MSNKIVYLCNEENIKVFYDEENPKVVFKKTVHSKVGKCVKKCFQIRSELEKYQLIGENPDIPKIFSQEVERLDDGCQFQMERADFDYIQYYNHNGKISIKKIQKFSEQISRALLCIHQRGLSHSDLKPDQFQIYGEDQAKLADFDYMTKKDSSELTFDEISNTFNKKREQCYFAPELVNFMSSIHNDRIKTFIDFQTCDVFSLGLSICQMLFLVAPKFVSWFINKGTNLSLIVKKKINSNQQQLIYTDYDEILLKQFIDLLQKMLTVNPQERITLKQVIVELQSF